MQVKLNLKSNNPLAGELWLVWDCTMLRAWYAVTAQLRGEVQGWLEHWHPWSVQFDTLVVPVVHSHLTPQKSATMTTHFYGVGDSCSCKTSSEIIAEAFKCIFSIGAKSYSGADKWHCIFSSKWQRSLVKVYMQLYCKLSKQWSNRLANFKRKKYYSSVLWKMNYSTNVYFIGFNIIMFWGIYWYSVLELTCGSSDI